MKTSRALTLFAFVAFIGATAKVMTADWSPQAAARYLDERQKQWFEWKPAMSANGPCVSCHTGMTYLLARPVLRRALKEDLAKIREGAKDAGLIDAGHDAGTAPGLSAAAQLQREVENALGSGARDFPCLTGIIIRHLPLAT